MIYFAKGDPMKVLMATAVVAATVSLNGDGTTTTPDLLFSLYSDL